MTVTSSALDVTERYLDEFVSPQANLIDHDPQALQTAFQGLGDRAILTLRADNQVLFRRFQETISRYSGALAFLQTQHQSAAAMIARSPNTALKGEYLPYLAQGERRVGVGFSHLRRPGTPPMQAHAVPGGYHLQGFVPWITGWTLFDSFILGAMLPDGTSVFGMMPFESTQDDRGGELTLSSPLEMAALTSTNTVTAEVRNWFLADDQVLFLKPPNWMHHNSQTNVLHHGFFALGCARAGLDLLNQAAERKDLPFLKTTWTRLDSELQACRQAFFDSEGEGVTSYGDRLRLRAWAIELAGRCSYAAVAAWGGAANSSGHPAQRVYREALVYAVSGQTRDVMEATLNRLSSSEFCP
ncbi:MAG: acyl-CoA dehydrogenase [Phormidium sp. BM_Day4_Bin.17]|nr:acyl-CoA dehydrogenase [Phormidium sp. BM_Day4_Bin.17]UCJ13564.1 MAG: acyl-CoA dehydrogenase [Phormidium sp. PBR-2020]